MSESPQFAFPEKYESGFSKSRLVGSQETALFLRKEGFYVLDSGRTRYKKILTSYRGCSPSPTSLRKAGFLPLAIGKSLKGLFYYWVVSSGLLVQVIQKFLSPSK
jgi:hypothetical protein